MTSRAQLVGAHHSLFHRTVFLAAFAVLALLPAAADAELILGVDSGPSQKTLTSFDSATPGSVTQTFITGLLNAANESILGIDYRPTNGQVYILTSGSGLTGYTLYTLDPLTAAASFVTAVNATVGVGQVGFDFSPVTGLLHVSAFIGGPTNQVIDPATGNVVVGPSYQNSASPLQLAFSNNVAGATSTTLYGVLAGGFDLATLDPATGGVSPVGVATNISSFPEMDISGATGIAYAGKPGAINGIDLATVDLTTGVGTVIGHIGGDPARAPTVGLTVLPRRQQAAPEPATATLLAVGLAALAVLARRRRD